MARNKYPEITVERILDAAQRLFLEKGYENTTIQDIVDELDGLTKGAVYHHFKSKEEIMDAVGDRMFEENNPFEAVMGRNDLNGLEKIREMIRLNQSDRDRQDMNIQSIPILKNPRVLAGIIDANRRVLTPYFYRADRGGEPGRFDPYGVCKGVVRADPDPHQPVACSFRFSRFCGADAS